MKRPRTSAGLLMFRRRAGKLEVLLAHPGGPYLARNDDGCRAIPKGEPEEEGADLVARAIIEREEEVGVPAVGDWLAIASPTQKGGTSRARLGIRRRLTRHLPAPQFRLAHQKMKATQAAFLDCLVAIVIGI